MTFEASAILLKDLVFTQNVLHNCQLQKHFANHYFFSENFIYSQGEPLTSNKVVRILLVFCSTNVRNSNFKMADDDDLDELLDSKPNLFLLNCYFAAFLLVH